MKLQQKIFSSFGIGIFLILLVFGLVVFQNSKRQCLNVQMAGIQNSAQLSNDNLAALLDVSIKNHLRTFTEKTEKLVGYYYQLYQSGSLTEAEALSELRGIITDLDFRMIGETGYIAVLNSDGLLLMHPFSEGLNVSGMAFWSQVESIIASSDGKGYFEYDWKNTNETEERRKAGYISYFKPWNLIIWSASYKEEFTSLLHVEDYRDNLLKAATGETGFMFVIDIKGNAIIHERLEGMNLADEPCIQQIIDMKRGTANLEMDYDGDGKTEDMFVSISLIDDLDWIVVSGITQKELSKPFLTLLFVMIIGTMVSMVLILLVSLLVSRSIAVKIHRFGDIFTGMGKGNLTRRYSKQGRKIFHDEIDSMGMTLNTVMESYRNIIVGLRHITEKVVELVQALSASAQETSATASQQAAAVKEIVSTMEDVDSLSKAIEKKIHEITNLTVNTQDTVKNGFETVRNTLEKMEEINNSNKTTIEGIKYLSEKIENIWDIVNIINGVADQTKIIAFNAELEASAAGEAGKNFQIVATEIRRLADSTVSSTNEIKNRITEIQKSSDRLILTSEEGTERIKEGNHLSQRINSLFQDILSGSEISTDSTRQISKSINQQVATFEQILIAIKQISEGVDNIAEATGETTNASNDLSVVSETLEEIADSYVIDIDNETSETADSLRNSSRNGAGYGR